MPRTRPQVLGLRALVVGIAVTLGGCGSILSSAEITSAATAVERAQDFGADAIAIYEFVSAEAYLDKAREEWGRSDFQAAVEYARRAEEFAAQAYERAARNPVRTTLSVDHGNDAPNR